jgi:F-type H+-transporting ATPase subunit gamma
MRDSIAGLRQKITSAEDLESVVRSMKTIASSSIGQYEKSVHSLDDYYQTVQLGLMACLSQGNKHLESRQVGMNRTGNKPCAIGVIVFGSDQGLVGQFNEAMVGCVVTSLADLPGKKILWSVGERIQSRLLDVKLKAEKNFPLPGSINSISALVATILTEIEAQRARGAIDKVYLFHHRPKSHSIYEPIVQQLLPLDAALQSNLASIVWPTNNLPEIIESKGMLEQDQTLRAFVREYLFVSLFRACAESLASENASRLAAMQRAEKNIDELQEDLNRTFHRLRQSGIDEELFDVLSGFNTLNQ